MPCLVSPDMYYSNYKDYKPKKALKFIDNPNEKEPSLPKDRLRTVTVVDSLGRVAPSVLGITVDLKAPPNAIIEAIKPLLRPPCARHEELLLTYLLGCSVGGSSESRVPSEYPPRLIRDDEVLDDRFFSTNELCLYR